jgi:peptidoglycan-N-acetylglucosamine deacetylase
MHERQAVMVAQAYLTTSWDDGHPFDLRVADLPKKYRLRGTFYVPMKSQNETMNVLQLRKRRGVGTL